MHIATNSEIDISLEVKTAELAKNFSKVVKKGDVVFFLWRNWSRKNNIYKTFNKLSSSEQLFKSNRSYKSDIQSVK